MSHQAPAPLTEQLGSIKPPFPHFTNDRFSAQKNNQCLAIQVKHGIFFFVILNKIGTTWIKAGTNLPFWGEKLWLGRGKGSIRCVYRQANNNLFRSDYLSELFSPLFLDWPEMGIQKMKLTCDENCPKRSWHHDARESFDSPWRHSAVTSNCVLVSCLIMCLPSPG